MVPVGSRTSSNSESLIAVPLAKGPFSATPVKVFFDIATFSTVSFAPCTLELDSGTLLELGAVEELESSFLDSEELSLESDDLSLEDEDSSSLESDDLSFEEEESSSLDSEDFTFEEEDLSSFDAEDSGSPISFQSFLVHS